MENSKIEWCDHTVNLWWGCYEVNKACDNCYAKTLANRYHGPHLLWQQQGPRMLIKSAFKDLEKYQARAAKEGTVYRIFINSMSDLFEKSMPLIDHNHEEMLVDGEPGYPLMTDEVRQWFFSNIYEDRYPNLFFILLTKRPSNITKMVPSGWLETPPANVIYMTSCPDQESLETLVPQLLTVPGKHGLSIEPLLGPIDLQKAYPSYRKFGPKCSSCSGNGYYSDNFKTPCPDCKVTGINNKAINWVICGGESGPGARPMRPDWATSIRDECAAAGVPFFFKQWGEYLPACQSWPEAKVHPVQFQSPNNPNKLNTYYRTGKKLAGSLLDGREHKQFPV